MSLKFLAQVMSESSELQKRKERFLSCWGVALKNLILDIMNIQFANISLVSCFLYSKKFLFILRWQRFFSYVLFRLVVLAFTFQPRIHSIFVHGKTIFRR